MAYFTRTLGTPTSSNNWTVSVWCSQNDRSNGDYDYTFSYSDSGGGGTGLAFRSIDDGNNNYQIYIYNSDTSTHAPAQSYDTTGIFHFVVRCVNGSINAYANGEALPNLTGISCPAMASGQTFYVGSYENGVHQFEGKLNDFVFVDGQSLTPSAFGQAGSNNNWEPLSPAQVRSNVGSFGNNGFFLTFEDAANLGHDYKTSGRTSNNDVTAQGTVRASSSGFSNKFAKLDWTANEGYKGIFYDNGALNAYAPDSNADHTIARSTHGILSGKWYWEAKIVGSSPRAIGIINEKFQMTDMWVGGNSDSWGAYWESSTVYCAHNNSNVLTPSYTHSAGDIAMFAYDHDAGKLWMGANGTWFNSGNPAAGTGNIWSNVSSPQTSGMHFPAASNYKASSHWHFNFGDPSYTVSSAQSDENGYGSFNYAPPSGFLSICDLNFPEPAVADPTDYFYNNTYTGSGGSKTITTGFPTDLVWITGISGGDSGFYHRFSDSGLLSLGQGGYQSPGANAAHQNAVNHYISAMSSTGFTVQQNGSGGANISGNTYSSLAWRGAGSLSTVQDSNGSNFKRSVNTTSGVSIINYTGDGNSRDIPHGLGGTADLVFIKGNQTSDWRLYSNASPSATDVHLPNSQSSFWGSSHGFLRGIRPDDTYVYLPNTGYNGHGNAWETNTSGVNYLMWVFKQVPGFSQFGAYRGRSDQRVKVTTNFRPSLVFIWWLSGSGSPSTNMRLFAKPVMGYTNRDNQDVWYLSMHGGLLTQNAANFHANGFSVEACNDQNLSSTGNYYGYAAFAEKPYTKGGNSVED